MAVTITISEVKQDPIAENTPDDLINAYIARVGQADQCLDSNQVPEAIQKAIKLNGIWHLIGIGIYGNAKSEKDPVGASITYKDNQGLDSTGYGQALRALDSHYCVVGMLDAGKRVLFEVI